MGMDDQNSWADETVKETTEKSVFDPATYKPSWHIETKEGTQHIKAVVTDKRNWIAGATVALVSVPLSIALGIASGTTPMRGLSTAVFGGLCAGFFGASDYNIVGPAGALSGMLMSYTIMWGEDVLPWLSLGSAVICAVCLFLRLDKYLLLMPKSVFEGFTVGVAVIIGLNQINFAFGLSPAHKHPHFVANIYESVIILDEQQWQSTLCFLLSTPVLWFLMRKVPKIPWMLVLPAVCIPIGWVCDTNGLNLLTLKSKYGMLKPELVQPLQPTSASFADMIIPSASIAFVAVLETLISAKIAKDRVDRSFSEAGEMRGLTIAHIVCGLTGAMPPTGVFVRTSLNTNLGATHRTSQVINACIVCIISLILMPLFSYLPQATIAAILVVASIRMTPFGYLKRLWAEDKGSLALCLVTAAVCVGEDPVIGIVVGMAIALLASAKKMLTTPFVDIKSSASGDKKKYRVTVVGSLTYVNQEAFVERVRNLENASDVSLDLYGLRQVDHDGICALAKVLGLWSSACGGDSNISISGVPASIYPSLQKHGWFKSAETDGRASTYVPVTGLPVLLGNTRKELELSGEGKKEDVKFSAAV
jgi:SulP family sulfate permease